jgi:hypothetical protein
MSKAFIETRVMTVIIGLFPAALVAQSLTGSVVADDSGLALAGATVVATQKTASSKQSPLVSKAIVDSAGHYSMTVAAGQYQLCVHGTGLYLDPCQWGTATVQTAGAAAVSIRLKKGARFILRVHDPSGHLAAAETVPHSAINAIVSGAGISAFPLLVTFDNGRIRDYAAVVPAGLAMTVAVSSGKVLLADTTGATPAAQGVPFQAVAEDLKAPASSSGVPLMFPRPTANIIHVYTTGLK